MHAFRKVLAPGGAIPLLVRLVLDLSLDEEMSELAALRFALEWHRLTSLRLPEGALVRIEVRQLVEPSRPSGHRSEPASLVRRPCGTADAGHVARADRGPERSSHP